MTLDGFQKIAPDIIAILAVTVAPYVIARRQAADNISAKRQSWIDELRRDSATFLQAIRRFEGLRRPQKGLSREDEKQSFDEGRKAEAIINEIGTRIKLRLNPTEDDHTHLTVLIAGLADLCRDPTPGENDDQRRLSVKAFNEQHDKIVCQLQKILKKEWERIKRGEISTKTNKLDYRVGLLRFWLVSSALWIGLASWQIDFLCLFGISFGDKPWCLYSSLVHPDEVAVQTFTILLGSPLVLALVLLGAFWIALGFRRDFPDNATNNDCTKCGS